MFSHKFPALTSCNWQAWLVLSWDRQINIIVGVRASCLYRTRLWLLSVCVHSGKILRGELSVSKKIKIKQTRDGHVVKMKLAFHPNVYFLLHCMAKNKNKNDNKISCFVRTQSMLLELSTTTTTNYCNNCQTNWHMCCICLLRLISCGSHLKLSCLGGSYNCLS